MSTRCNIIIKDNRDQLIFYRHSDGYPDGALPTLKKFMQWVADGKIRSNVEQASGWLILIGAEEYGERYEKQPGSPGVYVKKETLTEPDIKDDGMSWKCGAYEPSVEIHGDIEYLYTLDLKNLTIRVSNHYDENNSYTIEIQKSDNYLDY
jgi:hypothetical protein